MISKKLFLLPFIVCFWLLPAQESAIYTSHLKDYQKAMTLYNNNQFRAAQSLFENISNETSDSVVQSDCAYYIANCAVRLNQRNADNLVESFVEEYPTSPKRNLAYMDVGNYYFENSNYPYATKWFSKVDELSMERQEREQFYFRYGYCLYKSGDERGANKYLGRVKDSKDFGSQAKYYLGFMAYEGDDYDQATVYFEQVDDDNKYKDKLAYYQADLNFKLGKFEEAIALAEPQLTTRNKSEKSELSKIIGESYFNLGKYDEALPYLLEYEGKRGKWSNADYYQLGYVYYKQNDYEKAISEFNKIIDGDNPVAQNAYYHLGESYINLDKKTEALNAFRNASEMSFDEQIKEDAWLNYAKISYDIGNPYESVPQVLTRYLETYPQSSYSEEIETLLIDSYISSKNYKEALRLLKGNSGYENKLAFQKASFYYGLERYNESDYAEARDLFDQAVKERKIPEITARSTFWLAESDYSLSDYNQALIGFKQFAGLPSAAEVAEFKNLDYNLAYSYFKLKNYSEATRYFQSYISSNPKDKNRLNDAYLRLGDGYFVSSNYDKAIIAYNNAVKSGKKEMDYAAFQSAMSYGYLGQGSTKNKELEKFIDRYKSSALRDDALYELANTYVKLNDIGKAIATYERLNNLYPSSVFVPKAKLRQGLVYYNGNQNAKALEEFKDIALNYPKSEEAVQAVTTARLIYIDLGQVDEYARWVRGLDYVEVSDMDLDNTSYLAAEKQYLDGNTDKAIQQYNSYLNSFSEGIHALKSHFYLAQLYYQKNLPENARDHYKYVVDAPKNEYSEQSLLRLAEIYLNSSSWAEALPVLERLESEGDYSQNVLFAKSNLMKVYFQMENYSLAQSYASDLLNTESTDKQIAKDAQIIRARSAMATGDEATAREAYDILSTEASGSIAAESIYYKAFFQNKDTNYETSNESIQKLVKDYSSFKEFSAKGLIVMAKNYYELDDAFQATYILESVIANFSEFPLVVNEAKSTLESIKAKESKTNSSIQTNGN